ncbi:hypothetical protein EJ110_NYTH44449 [Nymphaea thermarum]|nr:hypothetical protein EJ110_NYTH44449 [Nymphaea thermarum]
MLLRSSSSPILHSWVVALSRDPLPSDAATDAVRPLRQSRSVTQLSSLLHLSTSSSPSPSSAAPSVTHHHSTPDTVFLQRDRFRPRIARKVSDFSLSNDEEPGDYDGHGTASHSVNRFFLCSGLDETQEPEAVLSHGKLDELCNGYCSLEADGVEGREDRREDQLKKRGEDGGAIDVNCSGGGLGKNDGLRGFCDGGSREREETSDSDSGATDAKYRKMIDADPSNSLLLRNYAKFLHEVEGDMDRAEEYYGRAMVADPFDGDVLSHYATLLWKERRDYALADTYFSRAIEASPATWLDLMRVSCGSLVKRKKEEEFRKKREAAVGLTVIQLVSREALPCL